MEVLDYCQPVSRYEKEEMINDVLSNFFVGMFVVCVYSVFIYGII